MLVCGTQVTSYHCAALVFLFLQTKVPLDLCEVFSMSSLKSPVLFSILYPLTQGEGISHTGLPETAQVGPTAISEPILLLLSLFQAWIIFWLFVPVLFILLLFYLSGVSSFLQEKFGFGPQDLQWWAAGLYRAFSECLLSDKLQTPGGEGAVVVLSMGERGNLHFALRCLLSHFKIEHTSPCYFLKRVLARLHL